MSKKKRILFGAVDIGYRIDHYSNFIKEHLSDNLEAESFSKYVLPKSHFESKFTYTCEVNKHSKLYCYAYSIIFFIYALCRFNIFHFLSGELILTRKLRKFEMWIYKLLKKKVIMHFVGADIRSDKFLDWKRENIVDYLSGMKNPFPMSEPYQLELIKDAQRYADHILVSTPDLLDIIPSAKYIPVFFDKNNTVLPLKKNKGKKIKILFSPSSHRTKGSTYVHNVLMKTNQDFQDTVAFVLPGKNLDNNKFYALSRYKLLETFNEVEVVIDQMIIGWYGLKAVEALYYGCEVISYIDDKYVKMLFKDCPIHNANILTLEKNLYNIVNKLKTSTIENNNREWVCQHHNIENYKNYFFNIWT